MEKPIPMPPGGTPDKISRSLTAVKIVVFLFFLILVVTFVVKNMSSVDLYYYNYMFQLLSVRVPLLFVILTAFALGYLLAWTLGFASRVRLRKSVRKQTKTIQDMNEEIQNLKSPKDLINR